MEQDIIANFTEERLIPARDVVFVGYPLGYFDETNNVPILRAGRIASIPKIDFVGQPQFLIDAQVYPGSSGSPVFVPWGGQYFFVGMLGKAYIRSAPLELQDLAVKPVITSYVGLGIVYKPDAIMEVVEQVAASQE